VTRTFYGGLDSRKICMSKTQQVKFTDVTFCRTTKGRWRRDQRLLYSELPGGFRSPRLALRSRCTSLPIMNRDYTSKICSLSSHPRSTMKARPHLGQTARLLCNEGSTGMHTYKNESVSGRTRPEEVNREKDGMKRYS